jgi:hypothetical protein
MKKLGLIFLLLLLGVTLSASDICVEGVYYNFDESTQEAQVTFRGDESDDGWMYYSASELYVGDLVIPESVTYQDVEYKVTSIGRNAFAGSRLLTSLHFPATIIGFGEDVFPLCESLHTITVADENSQYFVYSGVMYQKNPLEIFCVPRALSGVVEVYDGVTQIPPTAFNLCSSVEYVSIPNSVQMIGEGAFFRCLSLAEVAIGEGVNIIKRDAFSDCISLQIVSLPSSVKTIGSSAFSGCSNLFYISLNEGLETIDPYAFYGCSYISAVSLPSTLKSIGDKAFLDCYSLSMVRNNSPLDVEVGSTSHGYVAYYADDVLTTLVAENKISSNILSTANGELRFINVRNQNLVLYNLLGNTLYNGIIPSDDFTLSSFPCGLYLVSLSGRVEKVMISTPGFY